MTEPTKRKAPAKPRTRKPVAKPEEAVVPGEVVAEEEVDQTMRIQLIQRNFDQSDVALQHVILGGQDPIVLTTFDFTNKIINVDATLMTLSDLRNLFATLAEQLGNMPEQVGTKKFV
jgi:hypothetical protein